MKTLGSIIKDRRLELGLSMRGAAKKACMYESVWSHYENGRLCPNSKTCANIAFGLGLDADMLFAYSQVDNGRIPQSFLHDSDFMQSMYDKLEAEYGG